MTKEQAKKAVELILADLTDRSGLSNAWDGIDEDIQEEIKVEWIEAILSVSQS